ncbi:hypothetical protein CDIK_0494 [Cucumispora dikerogammari]|nr:hypothetical protein CDIK_0494 [Cucumispora dikerogammari]
MTSSQIYTPFSISHITQKTITPPCNCKLQNKNQLKNLDYQIQVLNQRLETKQHQVSLLKSAISDLNNELHIYRSDPSDDVRKIVFDSKKTFVLLGIIVGLLFLIGFFCGYNFRGCLLHIWPIKLLVN